MDTAQRVQRVWSPAEGALNPNLRCHTGYPAARPSMRPHLFLHPAARPSMRPHLFLHPAARPSMRPHLFLHPAQPL